jgi:DNA (cytosine-5)-methyltransferase 1
MSDNESIKVIDLFCGVGGLSHGFVQEGLEVVAGFDIDETCRYPFEVNNNAAFIAKDIREVTSDEINRFFGDASIKVLVGCAPCQPFSTYSFKSPDKAKNEKIAKWSLLNEFSRIIEDVKPHIVSMENVPGLAKFGLSGVFKDFIKVLEKNQYEVDFKVVYCPAYGVPQQRKRLVLLASRLGKIAIIPDTHTIANYPTVAQTIGKLEPIGSGEVSSSDPIHRAAKLSDLNIKRIQQSKPGGTWRDWDEDLLLDCHKRETGKTYRSVYGRMNWDAPAPTMTTFCTGIGNGRFGHPIQDRAISLREAALLQTFPQGYKFVQEGSTVNSKRLSTHIGNAVPVNLGRAIAKSIKFHLGI